MSLNEIGRVHGYVPQSAVIVCKLVAGDNPARVVLWFCTLEGDTPHIHSSMPLTPAGARELVAMLTKAADACDTQHTEQRGES